MFEKDLSASVNINKTLLSRSALTRDVCGFGFVPGGYYWLENMVVRTFDALSWIPVVYWSTVSGLRIPPHWAELQAAFDRDSAWRWTERLAVEGGFFTLERLGILVGIWLEWLCLYFYFNFFQERLMQHFKSLWSTADKPRLTLVN